MNVRQAASENNGDKEEQQAMFRATGSLRDTCSTSTLAPAARSSSLRSKILGTRLTDAEFHDLKSAARACGITPAELVRCSILGIKVEPKALVPQVNAMTYAALGKVGSNINQLAARVNSGKDNHTNEIQKALSQLAGILKNIRSEVLGRSAP